MLVWPKHLLIGADFGAFVADDYKTLKVTRTEVNRQRDEQQWRVALHYFLWKSTAMMTVLYRDDALQATPKDPQQRIRELTANLQFRF